MKISSYLLWDALELLPFNTLKEDEIFRVERVYDENLRITLVFKKKEKEYGIWYLVDILENYESVLKDRKNPLDPEVPNTGT